MNLIIPELAHPIDFSQEAFLKIRGEYRIEQKYDGVRLLAVSGDSIHFYTRSKRDITNKLVYLKEDFEKLPRGIVLDGELILRMGNGREELGNIQRVIGSTPERANSIINEIGRPVYQVFDVLWWAGEPVYRKPLKERVDILNNINSLSEFIRPIETFNSLGVDEVFNFAIRNGQEGIVIKDLSKNYEESYWIRKKGVKTADLVVQGFNPAGGRYRGRPMAGSLKGHLFDPEKREFVKVANIYGLSDANRRYFYDLFRGSPHYKIVVECRYSHRFPSGGFRFCSFIRIRDDKRPEDCTI